MKNLLKKIDSFYKLAVYSDRSEFLKALAENKIVSDKLPESLKGNFIADSTMLEGVGKGSEWRNSADLSAERKALLDAATFSGTTLDLDNILALYDSAIAKVQSAAVDSSSAAISNLGQHRQQLASYLGSLNFAGNKIKTQPQAPGSEETVEMTMNPTTIKAKYPSISPERQEALDKILSVEGLASPGLDPDGVLGPKTRAALDLFKKKFNDYSSSDEAAFAGIDLLSKMPKYM